MSKDAFRPGGDLCRKVLKPVPASQVQCRERCLRQQRPRNDAHKRSRPRMAHRAPNSSSDSCRKITWASQVPQRSISIGLNFTRLHRPGTAAHSTPSHSHCAFPPFRLCNQFLFTCCFAPLVCKSNSMSTIALLSVVRLCVPSLHNTTLLAAAAALPRQALPNHPISRVPSWHRPR